jgi:2-dehydro-3-deoxygluconokinase
MVSGALVTCGETMAALAGSESGPLRLGGSLRLSIAGSESNVAIGLARLGHPAAWIGRVGDDELGELVVRTLRAEGVDVTRVRRVADAPTGLMLKERRVGNVTRVHYYRAGSAGSGLSVADIDEGLVAGAAAVYVTGITPALGAGPAAAVDALVSEARRHGVPVVVGVNHRARLWPSLEVAASALRPLVARADYVLGGEDEIALVGGGAESARDLVAAGARAVVVTRGAGGAEAWTSAGVVRRDAVPVRVVDTVGAGDALCAGFLSGVLDGVDVEAALERGVVAAAFAVATAGDWEGLPSREELELLGLEDGGTVR